MSAHICKYAHTQATHTHTHIKWNLSIKDTLNKDTVCSPNRIDLCTNLPLN